MWVDPQPFCLVLVPPSEPRSSAAQCLYVLQRFSAIMPLLSSVSVLLLLLCLQPRPPLNPWTHPSMLLCAVAGCKTQPQTGFNSTGTCFLSLLLFLFRYYLAACTSAPLQTWCSLMDEKWSKSGSHICFHCCCACCWVNWAFYPGEARSQGDGWLQR